LLLALPLALRLPLVPLGAVVMLAPECVLEPEAELDWDKAPGKMVRKATASDHLRCIASVLMRYRCLRSRVARNKGAARREKRLGKTTAQASGKSCPFVAV
jgi:hypothetical protein